MFTVQKGRKAKLYEIKTEPTRTVDRQPTYWLSQTGIFCHVSLSNCR